VKTLLDQAEALREERAAMDEEELGKAEQMTAEERLLKEANTVSSNALTSKKDSAAGTTYEKSLETSWTCPGAILGQTEEQHQAVRDKWHILTEGDAIPPPIRSFRAMKLPPPLLARLKSKNIQRPTPIQMQGLPVALSGRDMVGIAFTGSGKTVSFSIPLCMLALEEERRLPLVGGEGPVGVILAPSRELARQTHEVLEGFANAIGNDPGYPELRVQLLIGGEDKRMQMERHDAKGIHGVVATPGRLKDLLKQKRLNFDICKFMCLDEADRMLDMGFDEEVAEIVNYFSAQRQTLLYSATFPKKFQDFAKETLVRPVVVNVGRAGAANLDVIQEVE
jgi:ATP-dependent RNA helicase DDX41